MASPETFDSLEHLGAGDVEVLAGDVKVCFYQYEMPRWPQPYFGVPRVASRHLPQKVRTRLLRPYLDHKEAQFQVRVVLMGSATSSSAPHGSPTSGPAKISGTSTP